MGAVNDLGNAVVVGRNLGYSGLENAGNDDYNMGKYSLNRFCTMYVFTSCNTSLFLFFL